MSSECISLHSTKSFKLLTCSIHVTLSTLLTQSFSRLISNFYEVMSHCQECFVNAKALVITIQYGNVASAYALTSLDPLSFLHSLTEGPEPSASD